MKTIYSAAASFALVLFSVSLGHAAPKPKDDSPAAQARTMLEQVESWSASIAGTADRLSIKAKSPADPEADLEGLNAIKDDVNKIGRNLRLLEAEQGSLTEWESRALNEIVPLMQEVATNAEKAIQLFDSDRIRLWATSFPEQTTKVFEDAGRVKERLDAYLKLETIREQEQRIESTVDGTR